MPANGMNKQALITGASSGIGLATAKLLLEKGHHVTGISRRGEVSDFADDNFESIKLDLADSHKTDRSIKKIIKSHDYDCFIHAAGYGEFGSIEQFSVEQIETAIRVNLTSALIICRLLVPFFRKQQRGQIIFLGSESAHTAGRKGAIYSAAKFGLRGFSQALREDCASDGIRVSLINPGMVRSPFFDKQSFAPGQQPENAIEPAQLAELIWFMLNSADNLVFDDLQVSPRVKTIDFSPHKNK